MKKIIVKCLGGLLLVMATMRVSASDLVVVQVSPMSGMAGGFGMALFAGAKACFDSVNSQGGIYGEKVRFLAEDDQFNASETMRLMRVVALRNQPVAFLNMTLGDQSASILDDGVLDQLKIPVIGIQPGSEDLRSPGNPWLFHTGSGDNTQIHRVISHLSTIGLRKLAVAYQDTPFGKSGVAHVDKLAAASKVEIVARMVIPLGQEDMKDPARELRKHGAQAYVMILAPNSASSLIRDVRASGDHTLMYGMSYLSVDEVLGKTSIPQAAGIGLAQVTPNPTTLTSGLTRDFHKAMRSFSPKTVNYTQAHLFGYIAARTTVEALRRAGPAPNPARLTAALRQLKIDFGGYMVDFSGGKNAGSTFSDIAVIDSSGNLRY